MTAEQPFNLATGKTDKRGEIIHAERFNQVQFHLVLVFERQGRGIHLILLPGVPATPTIDLPHFERILSPATLTKSAVSDLSPNANQRSKLNCGQPLTHSQQPGVDAGQFLRILRGHATSRTCRVFEDRPRPPAGGNINVSPGECERHSLDEGYQTCRWR